VKAGSLSPAVRRGLAVAILVVLIAVLYFGLVQPLLDNYLADRQTVAQLKDAVAKYRRAADELPARQAQLAALARDEASAAGFLQGPSETLMAAQVQNRIKSLSDAAKVDLRSSQVLPGAEEGKLKRIAVREQLTGTIGGILAVFHGLEATGSPSLFLDNVSLRTRSFAGRPNPPHVDEVIDVQFDVFGYTHGAG
jgi:type II secretory pathway component PulM